MACSDTHAEDAEARGGRQNPHISSRFLSGSIAREIFGLRPKESRILIFMPGGENPKIRRKCTNFIRLPGDGAIDNLRNKSVHREEDFLACHLSQGHCLQSRGYLVFHPVKSVSCHRGSAIDPEPCCGESKCRWEADRL